MSPKRPKTGVCPVTLSIEIPLNQGKVESQLIRTLHMKFMW